MFYFEELDGVIYYYGFCSVEVVVIIYCMDSLVGMLWQGIVLFFFGKDVNLIVIVDYGMIEISDDCVVDMNKYLCLEWCEVVDGWILIFIFIKLEYCDLVYNVLKDVFYIYVWKKEEIFVELNYGSSDCIGDIVVVFELGW